MLPKTIRFRSIGYTAELIWDYPDWANQEMLSWCRRFEEDHGEFNDKRGSAAIQAFGEAFEEVLKGDDWYQECDAIRLLQVMVQDCYFAAHYDPTSDSDDERVKKYLVAKKKKDAVRRAAFELRSFCRLYPDDANNILHAGVPDIAREIEDTCPPSEYFERLFDSLGKAADAHFSTEVSASRRRRYGCAFFLDPLSDAARKSPAADVLLWLSLAHNFRRRSPGNRLQMSSGYSEAKLAAAFVKAAFPSANINGNDPAKKLRDLVSKNQRVRYVDWPAREALIEAKRRERNGTTHLIHRDVGREFGAWLPGEDVAWNLGLDDDAPRYL